MGPSGSGKSTLLNCICGIEPLDAGTIHVGGQELSGLKSGEIEKLRRENMGYVFQSFHLLPTLNAYENVEFAAQLVGMAKEERQSRVSSYLSKWVEPPGGAFTKCIEWGGEAARSDCPCTGAPSKVDFGR